MSSDYTKQTWADYVSGTPTTNQTANAARMQHLEDGLEAAATDQVKSAAGVGGLHITRQGIDTPTGLPNEIIITDQDVAAANPQGLDLAGGQVGCTIADPGMAVIPSSTEPESLGNVLLAASGTRIAGRFKVYDTRIDRLTWFVGPGTPTSISGTIAICRASDGAYLASGTVNLSPATVDSTAGGLGTWTLGTPITGLTPLTELVAVAQHASAGNVIRYLARGISTLINPTALRASGTLMRGGAIAGASALSSPVDFTAAASWVKHPVPIFIASRTS